MNEHWYDDEKYKSTWSLEYNIGIDPYKYSINSHKEVHWKCEKGHIWKKEIRKRVRYGYGCPYCSGKRVKPGENDLATLNPTLAAEWNAIENGIKKPTDYTEWSNKKVAWLCPNGHSYFARINDRSRGRGCPYCAGKIPIKGENDLKTLRPDLADEWDYCKNDKLPSDYSCGSSVKVHWICPRGHEYKAQIKERVNGTGCSKCAHRIVVNGETDLLFKFPEIAKQWDFKKNALSPDKVFAYSNKAYWWICEKGHEWKAVVYSRTGKNKSGCPVCKGRMVSPGQTDFASAFPELLSMWNYSRNMVNPNDITAHSNKKVSWRCEKGHEWRTTVDKISYGTGCPYCYKIQVSGRE